MITVDRTDVAVCGGGLAGLTLALQLRRRLPDARITVIEPTRRPLPEACFKVGESTVEVGARYLGQILGLHDYLLSAHLRKNGLRFFSGRPASALEERTEMGAPEPPNIAAYQIDRGRLENDLRAMCEAEGVDLREGWGVRDVTLGEDLHCLSIVETRSKEGRGDPSGAATLEARWVIDATGRRRLLQKKLGLGEPLSPQASAAWFRVGERVKVSELVPAAARGWHERDVDGNRWLSTNHFPGRGYWVWVIPLGSGGTSIGLVAENECHDPRSYSSEEALRSWLAEHEPQLARRLEGVVFSDFIAMRDYRYFSQRVISPDRWACVGEAGLFVDPLYSPGADVIGLGNCLSTELVVDDLSGRHDPARVEELNGLLLSWTRMLSRTMVRGSVVFDSPEVLSAKLYWDYLYYWAMLCQYFFQDIYRLPVDEHRRFSEMLMRWRALNERAQTVLAAFGEVSSTEPIETFVGLPQPATTLSDLHLDLLVKKDPDRTYADMERALGWGEEVVLEVLLRALRRAGPSLAAEVARKVDIAHWPVRVDEGRLAADEADPRMRRKLLSKPVRDMERSIGKNVAAPEAPSLRELWKLAVDQP
jgi:flavin-dependent dehydrogenase